MNRRISRTGYWVAGAFLSLWVPALVLLPAAHDLDSPMSGAQVLGVFLYFLIFLGALIGWGSRVDQVLFKTTESIWIWPLLGTLPCVLFNAALGHLGLAGYSARGWTWAFTLAGYLLGRWPEFRAELRETGGRKSGDACIPRAMWVLLLLILLFDGALPAYQTDPQVYHLTGPRLWFDSGWIALTPRIPNGMLASTWEYLMISVNHWVAEPKGRGLFEACLSAQWIEIVLGYGGTLAALNLILKRVVKDPAWRWVALIIAASPSVLDSFIVVAKNDWGIAAWVCLGLWCLIRDLEGEKKAIWGAGMFCGLAFAGKLTAIFTLAPILTAWLVAAIVARKPGRGRRVAFLLLGGLISSGPILIRNWVETRNPFFPNFNTFFHSPWVSQSLTAIFYQDKVGFFRQRPTLWLERLSLFWHKDPWIFGLPLLGAFLVRSRKLRREVTVFEWATLVILPGYCILIGAQEGMDDGTYALRYLGAGLVFTYAVLGIWLVRALQRISRDWTARARRGLFLATCVCLVFSLRYPFATVPEAWKYLDQAAYTVRDYPNGGTMKAWLRFNASPSDLILTTGDNMLYFLFPLKATSVRDQPFFDVEDHQFVTLDDWVRFLVDSGVRYVLDTSNPGSWVWTRFSFILRHPIEQIPLAVAFAGPDGYVFDVAELQAERLPACWPPPFYPELLAL